MVKSYQPLAKKYASPPSVFTKWRRRARFMYLRFLRLKGSREHLARGLAAGVFAGFFPIFGLQIAIGVALAIPLRGHKLMAAAGTWVSNPLTYLPIFLWNFQVGRWLLGSSEPFDIQQISSLDRLLASKEEFALCLLVGCAVMGSIAAVIGYFLTLWGVDWVRRRRRTARIKRENRLLSG